MPFAKLLAGSKLGYRSTFRYAVIVSAPLLISLLSVVGIFRVCNAQDQAPERKKLPDTNINYREPKREYRTVKMGKWSFEIEQQLINEAPEIATQATKRLQENLETVFRLIPKPSQPKLKPMKFFVLYGPKARGGGRDNGLEYFRTDAPKWATNADERWSNCIVVYSAENYTVQSDLWALKALIHEIGHAHHLENWEENQPHIMEAWQHAVDAKLYVNVQDEKGGIVPKAYATTNQLEYFAELTAIYFAKGDYAPFNRVGLKKYDPMGYELVRKMWGVDKKDPPPPSTKELKKDANSKD